MHQTFITNNILTEQTVTEEKLLNIVDNLEKIVVKVQSELCITKNVKFCEATRLMIYSCTRDDNNQILPHT